MYGFWIEPIFDYMISDSPVSYKFHSVPKHGHMNVLEANNITSYDKAMKRGWIRGVIEDNEIHLEFHEHAFPFNKTIKKIVKNNVMTPNKKYIHLINSERRIHLENKKPKAQFQQYIIEQFKQL